MLSRYVVSQVKHNSYFLVGLALGLWVSLAVVPIEDEGGVACGPTLAPLRDEYEPHREERPLAAARAPARSVQRPRYYSTELGMRGSLLTGVLSSEEALKSQIVALNQTSARLQPALKFFITASAMSSVPGLANVVGFTDTREMLKPFHALKYLADNFLEEYDFFFLVSDTSYVNALRLTELVSKLSVSQDVYMGMIAEDDSHYCSLEGGILVSNSVLRAVHAELDWCVRNSYSPHHHENIGRCVLHAARLPCADRLQGERYESVLGAGEAVLSEGVARAVTVRGAGGAARLHALHAYVSRVRLQRERAELRRLRAALWRAAARHPPGYRNATWPGGLRLDPGLAPPLPDTRFDHLRWISFNETHAFFPDDHHEIALIEGAHRQALDLVLRSVQAWALRRWTDAGSLQLVEGAWRWEPARALHYRLVVRLAAREAHTLRLLQVTRPLGPARLVPVRYVTESARVTLLLGVPTSRHHVDDALAFLQRYETVCLQQDKNTALVIVIVGEAEEMSTADELRAAVAALGAKHAGAALTLLESEAQWADDAPRHSVVTRAQHLAARDALPHVPQDALLLLMVPHAEFSQDFLNRVRMNTIAGSQWYLPLAFARYALYDNPRFVSPAGGKPTTNTGRFNARAAPVLAAYRADLQAATLAHPSLPPAEALTRSALHAVRAPEPALVLQPRPAPCAPRTDPAPATTCVRALARDHFAPLDLGARHSLAQLLLEHEADAA